MPRPNGDALAHRGSVLHSRRSERAAAMSTSTSIAVFGSLVLPTLFAAIASAGESPAELVTNRRTAPLTLTTPADPMTVVKGLLFVTSDGGKTWLQVAEALAPADGKGLPRFQYDFPTDGTYGLWTVAVFRDGHSEPAPAPGKAPAAVLVIDTQAPAINRFDATLSGRAATKALVQASWSVSDPRLDREPVVVEASSDGGATFTVVHRGGADGATELTLPVAAETKELQLRVVATDRAQNRMISPVRTLPAVLPPPDPAVALAKAAAALPTLAEIGAAPPPVLPTITVPPPVAKPEPAPVLPTASVAPVVTTPEKLTPVAKIEPAKPPFTDVIILDPPGVVPPVAPSDDIVAGSNQTEHAYYRKLAAARGEAPINSRTAARPAPSPQAAATPTTAPTRQQVDGNLQPAQAEYLHPDVAERTLTDARWLVRQGNVDDACEVYERLRLSPLAKIALLEEVQLLNRNKRPRDALKLSSMAAPELISDTLRLEMGKAMLATGRHVDALAVLSEVNGRAAESREALLLIGRAYAIQSKTTEARRVFEHLAKGSDEIAAAARSELSR